MRGKRVKILAKLVRENDPHLLLSIRKKYGEKTKDMEKRNIYLEAKKLWTAKVPDRLLWGN